MATVEAIRDRDDEQHTLVQLQSIFQRLEASARPLSRHVDLADYDTGLISYCMTMAREAERGYMLLGEVMETPAA